MGQAQAQAIPLHSLAKSGMQHKPMQGAGLASWHTQMKYQPQGQGFGQELGTGVRWAWPMFSMSHTLAN